MEKLNLTVSGLFSQELKEKLALKHMLKHAYYVAWQKGEVSIPSLQLYARQYYHHVKNFPRYLSSMHSLCEDLPTRQILLENLIEEERGAGNHPELWMRFAEGLGEKRDQVKAEKPLAETANLVDTFMSLSRSSIEEGLGALFAYEHQIPEVSTFKIDCLKHCYSVSDSRTLSFFEVHQKADVVHSQVLADLMNSLPVKSQEKVENAALQAGDALWAFLDGMEAKRAS